MGDVVVLSFPFSDLNQSKRRPALVLAGLDRGDLILCQITSQVKLDGDSLNQTSWIRPNKLFTADSALLLYSAGRVRERKRLDAVKSLLAILSRT